MAMVRESVALTSSSASPRLRVSPPRAMTSSPKFLMFGGGRSMNALPEFKGLKIQSPLKSSLESLSLRMPRVSPHNIVSEAQETALDVPTVNETTWESLVLKADGPVLVEFWASWCGPCRMIHPVIDEIAKQYAGKLKCFRLNTDESPSIASDYGIRSIPTLMIFVNGEKKEAVIGAVPKTTLTASIEKFL